MTRFAHWGAGLALGMLAAAAGAAPLEGLWKSYDAAGQPKALVRFSAKDGAYSAKIEQLFGRAADAPPARCRACAGALHDAPIVGLTIIDGLRRDGNVYGGGKVLDPEEGTQYDCQVTVADDGASLSLRGYIGTPFLGRSFTWRRAGT